ncbi:AAA family ATPase [Candidatus Gracilibacteria bacterium]|nr:AAA family ATPase [Candidatus Gracilibacteria bacterium]
MERIAIYGKGGIGKSTISCNISAQFSKKGMKVLQVGCDPKADSTKKLTGGKRIKTIMEMLNKQEDYVSIKELSVKGFNGIDCIEAGGPIPGTGCAGRGISKMFEIFDDVDLLKENYDVILFDVLGDVVCGGFASPLRMGYGEKIFIVISEEIMSMYACNNICKAVREYSRNGVYIGGVIVNARSNTLDKEIINKFVKKIGLDVIAYIPRSDMISCAEYKAMTLSEYNDEAEIIKVFDTLVDDIITVKKESKTLPNPMSEEEFDSFFKSFEVNPSKL